MWFLMERLIGLRQKNGLTQREVAQFWGVDRTTYVKYERGDSEPNFDTILKLADFFDTTTDYILGKTNNPKSLDEQLEGIEFALFGEVRDMTDEEKQDVLEYIKFKKSQKK